MVNHTPASVSLHPERQTPATDTNQKVRQQMMMMKK